MGDSLLLATIRDDTWNVLNMQHIIPNPKKWDYSDIPGGGHKQSKGPAHMVEGDHRLQKNTPQNTHIDSKAYLEYTFSDIWMNWTYVVVFL